MNLSIPFPGWEINCIQNSWICVSIAQNAIIYCQWQAIHHCIDCSCRIAQKHDIFRWRTYREKPKEIFKISLYLFQENSIKMFKPKKSATRFKLELYISRAFPLKNWSGWDSTSVNRSNLKKYIHLAGSGLGIKKSPPGFLVFGTKSTKNSGWVFGTKLHH